MKLLWLTLVTLGAGALVAADHQGRVRFNGLPVPGATVTAARSGKKLVAVTGADGAYAFPGLTDGPWKFHVEMPCFETVDREVVIAHNAPAALWDLRMLSLDKMKSAAKSPLTTTTVAAPTPSALPANSSRKAAPNTPASPNGFQRASLKATPAPAAAAPLTNEPPQTISTAEANQAADGFLINGSANNGAASIFGQAAAFGNFRKNGRSLYNAGIGIMLDNSALDARAFSLTGQDTPKPSFNHMQGVASFGGPIKKPHSFSQTSPTISLIYQWTRNRNATNQAALVPTADQRLGILDQPLTDPITGSPFANNVIPQSRISPQAQVLLKFYPLPNFAAAARYNYQTPILGTNDQDSFQSRINKFINAHNQIGGTFGYQRASNENSNLFAFRDSTGISGIDTTANWSHRFGQRIFANFRLGYNRQSTRVTPYFANRENVSAEAGITGNNQEPLNWGPPTLSFSRGIAGLSDAQQAFTRDQTASASYSTYWNRSPHNVSFGLDYHRQQFNYLAQQNPRGSFSFTGAAAGSDFGGFLLGVPDTSSIAFGNADKYFRANAYDAYLTDDWRISPRLTVNAGVRWEYSSPITERYGRLVNLDVTPGFTSVTPVIARDIGTPLLQPDPRAFQPRAGIALRPIDGASLVIRAGYGITYDTSIYESIASRMAQQSPLSKSLTVANSAADPLTLASGFNASPSITPNTFAVDPKLRVGYAQTWNLAVQRDLPGSLVIIGTYLGIKGTRAMQTFLPNTYPTGAVNPCPACPIGFTYLTSNGNSSREAAQLQLRRRLRSGIAWSADYTFSKSLDDAALGGRGQGGSLIAQNWLDLSAERGRSTFDQGHLLNVLMQYSTGVGRAGGTLLDGWRGRLFKDWTFTDQITVGSGLPGSPVYIAAVRGTGVTGTIRPEYTGAPLYSGPSGLYLNPAAFTAPLDGQWGNAGRNSINGPMQFALSASIGRTFRINDRLNADFRLDSTNALNHVTYTAWNTNITSTQFGLPVSANAMRTVRANLRVRF